MGFLLKKRLPFDFPGYFGYQLVKFGNPLFPFRTCWTPTNDRGFVPRPVEALANFGKHKVRVSRVNPQTGRFYLGGAWIWRSTIQLLGNASRRGNPGQFFFFFGNAFEPRVTIGNRMQQVTHISSLVK